MLKSIKINKIGRGFPSHLKENLLHREFSFYPGLNILYGQNGAGKSTLINTIKAAYQIPLKSICSKPVYVNECKFEYKVNKDNEAAIDCDAFFHATNKIDEYFDYGIEQVLLTYDKGSMSQGENKMEAQLVLAKYIESTKWQSSFDRALPLLIMDEPTLSMSFQTERAFFNYMAKWAHGGYQIILATNSIACFGTEFPNDVHFIEIEKDSIQKVKTELKKYLEEIGD